MLEVAWQRIRRQPGRFAALAAAIALPVVLVLVVGAVYLGLLEALVAFPRTLPGDLIVTEAGGPPLFMRSASRIPTGVEEAIAALPGVAAVTPLHGRLVWVESGGRRAFVFVVGLLPEDTAGGPVRVLAGKSRPGLAEILVDRVLAHDLGLRIGSRLRVAGARLRVAGITAGGNGVIGTFGFAHRNALVLGGVFRPSHLLVHIATGANAAAAGARIARVPGVQVWSRAAFIAENQAYARQFYRPIIGIVAGLAAIVGGLVLGLTLWAAALERREEYGLLRALGVGRRRVYAVALWHAAFATGAGVAAGIAGGLLLAAAVAAAQPRFVTVVPAWLVAGVAGGGAVVGLLAALLPVRAVTRVDPALVFRV
jgi:putative ABC transport system permease protein